MVGKIRNRLFLSIPLALGVMLFSLVATSYTASALNPLPTPKPKPGSYGLEATKVKAPPKTGARITIPANGASFTSSPITVRGIAPNGLLVQIYNNGVLVGSVMSKGGSFSLQVTPFTGTNEFTAIVYDELNQPGPVSNKVRVTYNNTNFSAFGEQITLTSAYGRLSAAAGSTLKWPLQLTGGTGPYAISIDWGDGSKPQLMSQVGGGVINISHVYKQAGVYQVNVQVTDVNGVTAYIQLVAVANGKPGDDAGAGATTDKDGKGSGSGRTEILWWPAAAALILLPTTYWLGRRSMLVSLRNKMLKEHELAKKMAES